jgi:phosphatidylserine synthase
MTQRTDRLLRTIFLFAGLPFLFYVITGREPDLLYYLSLALILAGVIYNMISDWKQGKHQQVKRRLLFYLIFLAALAVIAIVQKAGR